MRLKEQAGKKEQSFCLKEKGKLDQFFGRLLFEKGKLDQFLVNLTL